MPERWMTFIFVAGLILPLTGCGWLIKPPEDQPQARHYIETATALNSGLNRYKGLAQAHLHTQSQSIKGRIALAAAAPNRMRVEWLSAMGQPLTSLAGDGEIITVISHAEGKRYQLPQLRTALERMVHIPIGIEELLSILAGRPPLPDHTAAQMDPRDARGETILIKNRWRVRVARLHVDRSNGRIKLLEAYDDQGSGRYQVEWRQWRTLGDYTLPKQVIIRTSSKNVLTLVMDRFWPDAEVAPEMFILYLKPNT